MSSIAHRLAALADQYGRRPAVIDGDEIVSFADLVADTERTAFGLARLGASKGTRIGILMPNRADWLRCAFAAWRLGAVLVPINTLYRGPELRHALRLADVALLITVSRFLSHDYAALMMEICPELREKGSPLTAAALPALRHVVCQGNEIPPGALPWRALRPDTAAGARGAWAEASSDTVAPADDAAIFFTSGSTAAPKGVVHTHASMLQAADNVADRLGLTADDRTYGYLPLFFNGGMVAVCLATLSRGGAVLLQELFDAAEALRLMERHGCTTVFAWPHQAEALIRHPRFDRSRLRIRKGSGANTKWAAELYPPDHQAVGTWGMTETGPMAASSRFDDPLELRAGCHGRAMPGLEIRIVDPETNRPLPAGGEGEIVVRGRSLMRTYCKESPADCFDAEGYFHTGDCGRLDDTGHLHFLGRLKDVIKTAGVSVSAAEIEAVLATHPSVKVAHVVPVPHPTRGENVGAFVVRRDPSCEAKELLEHCRTRLASYKVPRLLFFVEERDLPVLGSGKVDRRELGRRAVNLARND